MLTHVSPASRNVAALAKYIRSETGEAAAALRTAGPANHALWRRSAVSEEWRGVSLMADQPLATLS